MPKVPVTCQECGKTFEANRSDIKRGRKYCSHECSTKAHIGENNPRYKGKVIKKCEECGKEFPVYESVIKNGHGKFCSHVCKGIWQSKNVVGEKSPAWTGGGVIKKCEECGKEFPVEKGRIKSGRGKYCSKACSNKAKSRLYSGENSWEWKEKIIRKCRTCGKEIQITPSRAEEKKGYYCSKECYSQDVDPKFRRILKNCMFCGKEFPTKPTTHRPNGANYCSRECFLKGAGKNFSGKNRIKNICPVCGKEFESFPMRVKKSEILYCSRKCYAIDQSKRFVGENSLVWKEKIKRICPVCNSEFPVLESRVESNRGIYCSKKCQNIAFGESVTGEKNPNWTGGPKEYCEKWSPEFRRRIRAFFDHKCAECGTPQNEKLLHCHHVYYDKKACCSVMEDGKCFSNLGVKGQPFTFEIIGDPNKFVALCHNCHAKTSLKKHRQFWARHFEEIINNYYLGRSYFTKEEYEKIR
jgi:endogenous inhibitor of DNA gyrase (YacG/DUF329 family)